MKSRPRIAVAVSVALLAMVASPAWAQKNSAAASFSAPFTGDDTITASIDKGKKKRLLIADASAVIADSIAVGDYCDLLLTLTANGVVMFTTSVGDPQAKATCDCSTVVCLGCTLNATGYLDLDAAEAANPGLFVKQPIQVDLRVVTDGSGGCTGGFTDAATLVVQMIKK